MCVGAWRFCLVHASAPTSSPALPHSQINIVKLVVHNFAEFTKTNTHSIHCVFDVCVVVVVETIIISSAPPTSLATQQMLLPLLVVTIIISGVSTTLLSVGIVVFGTVVAAVGTLLSSRSSPIVDAGGSCGVTTGQCNRWAVSAWASASEAFVCIGSCGCRSHCTSIEADDADDDDDDGCGDCPDVLDGDDDSDGDDERLDDEFVHSLDMNS